MKKLVQAIKLVLALNDTPPESNVPGYIVKLDPKAKEQLEDALTSENPPSWVTDIKIHDVVWDEQAKEFVLVTNKKCVLPHSDTIAYNRSHPNQLLDCDNNSVPFEGIAIRLISYSGVGVPTVGWTYRSIDWRTIRLQTGTIADNFKKSIEHMTRGEKFFNSLGRV